MPGIAARHARLVFSVMMSGIMALIVTGVVTLVNTGLDAGFPARWLRAYVIAWPIAGCCILLFGEKVRRLAARLTAS